MSGYVLAYRTAWTHEIFNDFLEAAIWNFLFQNAFWEDGVRNFNGTIIPLKRGQIAITPRYIAQGFRISERGARNVIQKLEKCGMIETKATNKATIITICNYDKFQGFEKTEEQPNGKQAENRGRPKDANKNQDKQDKQGNIFNADATPKTPLKKRPEDVPPEIWDDWLRHRKEKRAPTSGTIIDHLRTQGGILGWPLSEVMREQINRNWQGFKADWILRDQQSPRASGQMSNQQRVNEEWRQAHQNVRRMNEKAAETGDFNDIPY